MTSFNRNRAIWLTAPSFLFMFATCFLMFFSRDIKWGSFLFNSLQALYLLMILAAPICFCLQICAFIHLIRSSGNVMERLYFDAINIVGMLALFHFLMGLWGVLLLGSMGGH